MLGGAGNRRPRTHCSKARVEGQLVSGIGCKPLIEERRRAAQIENPGTPATLFGSYVVSIYGNATERDDASRDLPLQQSHTGIEYECGLDFPMSDSEPDGFDRKSGFG